MQSGYSWGKISSIIATLLASVSCQYAPDDAGAKGSGPPETTGEVQLAITSYRLELAGMNAGVIGSVNTGTGSTVQVSVMNIPSTLLTTCIQEMLNQASIVRDGAVVTSDGRNDIRRLEFTNAFLTQVGVPALDVAVQAAGTFDLTLAPDRTREFVPNTRTPGTFGAKPKAWSTSAFRVTVGTLPTSHVSTVGAMTFKRPTQMPGALQLPNLAITFADADATPWVQWYTDFVVNGHSGDVNKKTATIELLSSDLTATLATFTFTSCGISALTQQTQKRTAQLVCTTGAFSVP